MCDGLGVSLTYLSRLCCVSSFLNGSEKVMRPFSPICAIGSICLLRACRLGGLSLRPLAFDISIFALASCARHRSANLAIIFFQTMSGMKDFFSISSW